MDFATILGLIVAVASLILGFTMDNGVLSALLRPTAVLLVFGGTIGATMVTVPMKQFLGIFKYLKIAMFYKSKNPLEVIEQLVQLASIARREGILALEDRMDEFPDSYMKTGVQLIVDGVDPELVKSMMETELSYLEERHISAAKIFEAAGGFAPTMGIIGTVMGLVHVLGNLKNIDVLGPQIASAFTATLYGVASANVFWLPIASKLRSRNAEEVLLKEIVLEGVLSIQAGENPKVLSQKLLAFLAPDKREAKSEGKVGELNGEKAQA